MKRISFIFCTLFFIVLLVPYAAFANQCMDAINYIAPKLNVPKRVVMAVALTETGTKKRGKLRPYPWAINVEGRGALYPNKQQAIAAVKKYLKQGKTSIDIGCMQLNWRWHGHKFDHSLEKAFDPYINIQVGANYIKQHFKKHRNWRKAAGNYHSGTMKYALKYQKKYSRNLVFALRHYGMNASAIQLAALNKKSAKISDKSYDKTKTAQNSGSVMPVKPNNAIENKPYTHYKIARLNQAAGSLFKFENMGAAVREKPHANSKSFRSIFNKLPSAPQPILNTERKRHLFR